MLAMDIWYAITIYRTQKPPAFWATAIVVAAAFGVTAMVLIPGMLPYPIMTLATLPGMLIASFVTALGGIWLGQLLGDMNNYQGETAADSAPTLSASWVPSTAYIVYAIGLLLFVMTATPPA